ncbi:Fet3 protein [Flagelloscypha sp. PMI_526]|nr:Fet3 protein [Flagelloscypha sp. PMI_526]
MVALLLFGSVLLFAPNVLAGLTEVWWNLTYVSNVNPDGLFPRRAIGVNGTWPPPPLEVSTNDTLLVHTRNLLDKPMTLHHHGMFFNNASWYDGAMGLSQCGIPPGEEFTYVIPANESGQVGTYWVHAHAKGGTTDGLRAPFILRPPTEVHAKLYDEEYTVILGDWYHEEQAPMLEGFISKSNPGGAEPVPQSPLIYFAQNGSYLAGFNDKASLPFQAGKTYRLRIVNAGAFAMFFFWIDGHQMQIIEVDGTDTEPMAVDLLSLTVAQRYSILVTARNDSTTNWAIHANMDTDMFDQVPDDLNPNATAQVTYSSSFSLSEPSTIDAYADTNDTALQSIPAIAQYRAPEKTIELLVLFDTMDDGTNRAMFNDITYNAPVVPTVFSAVTLNNVTGQAGANSVPGAYGPWNYVLELNGSVDLVVQNSDAGKHPFHLHGHKFQIVNRASDFTSDDPTLNPPLVEGQANPVRRDVVQIESGGSATLRFIADNPGAWFLHCHIEWHLEAGLAVTFITAPNDMTAAATAGQHPIPSSMYSHCSALGIPTSGNAAGLASTTDLKGLNLGPFPQNNGWHPKGIGAMFACVFTAVLGMLGVAWYSWGEQVEDYEVEEETRRALEKKEKKGKGVLGVLGLGKK